MQLERKLPYIALLICAVFGLLYVFISPPTTTPDEIAHLAYPRHLLTTKQLPSFLSSEDFWESHQPPLYYILSLPATKLFASVSVDTQLQLDRLTSWFIYLATLFSMIFVAKKLFNDNPLVQASVTLFLGIPMVSYLAGAFSNDILMVLITTWLCYWILGRPKKSFSVRESVFFGFLIGAGLLTKLHLYPILFFAGLLVLLGKKFFYWIITGTSAAFISWWWFAHNFQTVGDIFGLKYTTTLWQSQQVPISHFSDFLNMLAKIFAGFWGVFGKFNISFPLIVYVFLLVPALIALIYACKNIKQKTAYSMLLLISGGIIFVVFQNFTFFQPQGRYLLSIVPACAILVGYILERIKARQRQISLTASIFFCIIALNIYGLILVNSYYQAYPIKSLTSTRTISLLELAWNGETQKKHDALDSTTLELPVTLFTLQDMRLATSNNPTIHILSENASGTTVVVFWKRLGDSTFSDARSVSGQFKEHLLDIELPVNTETLLQDIKVEFQGNHDSITLQEFSLFN